MSPAELGAAVRLELEEVELDDQAQAALEAQELAEDDEDIDDDDFEEEDWQDEEPDEDEEG